MSVPNAPLIGYRNLLSDPATTLDAFGASDPSRAVDWRLDRAWQPGSTVAVLRATSSRPMTADYLGLCGHSLGGGIVAVLAEVSGSMELLGEWFPTSDRCLMATFPRTTSSVWEVSFSAVPNPVVVAVCALGEALPLDSGLRQGFVPPPFTQQAEVLDTTSQDGIPLGRTVRPQPGRLTINVTDLDEQWMRRHWLRFRRHARDFPFFLSWNPAEFPEEAGLCWAEGAPSANPYTQPGFMDGQLRCRVLTEVLV